MCFVCYDYTDDKSNFAKELYGEGLQLSKPGENLTFTYMLYAIEVA